MKASLPKWHQVYQGDEESKFFIALVRHAKYEWRSTQALAKESGLSVRRVEEIINKYLKTGIIIQSTKNEDMWAYWERVPQLVPNIGKSIAQQDQGSRIDGACSKWDFQTELGDAIREKYAGQYVKVVCVENIFCPTRMAPDVPVETLPGAPDLCAGI